MENVLELLDSDTEHYIDTTTTPPTLYYQPNATGMPSPSLDLAVPVLKTLLMVNASQQVCECVGVCVSE